MGCGGSTKGGRGEVSVRSAVWLLQNLLDFNFEHFSDYKTRNLGYESHVCSHVFYKSSAFLYSCALSPLPGSLNSHFILSQGHRKWVNKICLEDKKVQMSFSEPMKGSLTLASHAWSLPTTLDWGVGRLRPELCICVGSLWGLHMQLEKPLWNLCRNLWRNPTRTSWEI